MTNPVGLIFVSIAVGGSLLGGARRMLRGRRERGRARAELRSVAPLELATADGALARITGTVALVDGQTLRAPLSGLECVAYRTRVGARNITVPGANLEELRVARFMVDDVLVESDHVRLDLDETKLTPSPAQRDRYDEFLATYETTRHGGRFGRHGPVFEEIVVSKGDRITVVGLVMLEPVGPGTSELGFRDGARPRVRIVGNAEHPIAIGNPLD